MITTEINVPSDQINAELCRRSFYRFFLEFWDTIEPGELVVNWHLELLCNELQAIAERMMEGLPAQDLIINIPPGTTKSTIATVMLTPWIWTRMPEAKTISASYSGQLSTDHSGKSKDVVESEKYRAYYPEVKIRRDTSGKGHYRTTKGGERYSTSTKGTATGKHGHLIIVDDPMNPKIAASEPERKTANEFLSETLASRKVDKSVTPTILIMQRLHVDDPTGHLLHREPERWKHICLPAEVDDNIKPKKLKKHYVDGLLDPKRMGDKVLRDMEQRMGSYAFAGQMMQRPRPKGGGIWKENYFKTIKREDLPSGMHGIATDWDLAYTSKEKNSASAYVQSGYWNGNMYIIEAGAVWKEFPELIQFMQTMDMIHYVEDKASGKSAVQTLWRKGVTASLVAVNGDKIARTRDVTPHAESGRVYIVEDIRDYVLNDRKQGIMNLTEENDDIDLNDALTQAISRHLGRATGEGWKNLSSAVDELADESFM